MFNGMLEGLKEETVGFLFNLQVEAAEPEPVQVAAADVPQIAVAQAQAQGSVAAPPAPPQPAPGSQVPPALRGKGLDQHEQQRLSYSGPDEEGGVDSRSDASEANGDSGTRRERRAAARSQSKQDRKRPRR
jgi:preprotein translocase subunit SecA